MPDKNVKAADSAAQNNPVDEEVKLDDLEKFAGGTMENVSKDRTHDITDSMKDRA